MTDEEYMTDEELKKSYIAEIYVTSHANEILKQNNAFISAHSAFIAGYDKANELHCTQDKLPPEDVPLLCVRGGKIYVAWYWDNIYHNDKCKQVKKPYAWKEIILPEE